MSKGRCSILTIGCKVNQSEAEALASALQGVGWEIVPFGCAADCIIVNTCCVTARGEGDSRRAIRRAKRIAPAGIVIATGCLAQLDPTGLLALGADGVVGNQQKGGIVELVERWEAGGPLIAVTKIGEERVFPPLPQGRGAGLRTRAFLKIQDGCNANCSYCIVPATRGKSRSLPPAQVLSALGSLAEQGYQEAVLVGVHLGAYGLDLSPKADLLRLLERIEGATTPRRIRLSSLEPQEVSPGLLSLIASSAKICPHLHLPLQSGADEILKLMRRPYTASYFGELVQEVAAAIPDAAIGADVMVGFPGEDEVAFSRTYDLIAGLPIAYLHIFPFSPRKGTAAATMPARVEEGEKRRRAEILRALGRKKREAFSRRFLGRSLPLLVEHRRQGGMLCALSRNYIRCLVEGGEALMGEEVEGVIVDIKGDRGVARVSATC